VNRFYLIRHGEKDSPEDILAGRTPGVLLTPRGQQQANELAEFLAPAAIQHVFSSPLERAHATAEAIARILGLPVKTSDAFNEIDFGTWTNRSITSLEGDSVWSAFNSDRSKTRIPAGETTREIQQRFLSKMVELQKLHPGAEIVIVSHAEPIRAALLHFMRASLDDWSGLEIAVASISIIDVDTRYSRIFYVNHTLSPRRV